MNREARELLVEALTPRLVEVVDAFRGGIDIGRLEGAYVRGTISGIEEALVPDNLIGDMAQAVDVAYGDAIESGAQIGLRFAGVPGLDFPGDGITEAARRWVTLEGANRIENISGATRLAIRRSVNDALSDAISPQQAATRIGLRVGLAPRDITALQNFEEALVKQRIPNALADTQLTRETIARDVENYRSRLLRTRGQTIAETEMQAAIQEGERQFWVEAARAQPDLVNIEAMQKTWFTVEDLAVCPICRPLHDVTVGFSDSFASLGWMGMGPPAHPRCRCYLTFKAQEQTAVA